MIRLGLRLSTAGGRGALVALLLTALSISIGTAILLFALAFKPALDSRSEQAAWRTSFTPSSLSALLNGVEALSSKSTVALEGSSGLAGS